PYKIWLSEIILQQTRVEQGWAYYERFVSNFPTVASLANASEKQVMKLWEGLGYYSRCRNLMATAKIIRDQYHAVFPATYEEILSLKGVGPYTAAAISSFAFNHPYAVCDGNVMRVLARFFNLDWDISSAAGKKQFAGLAQELIDTKKPALFNQAIMDLGATICTPQQPKCVQCPLRNACESLRKKNIEQRPVKTSRLEKKIRCFHYLVLEYKGRLLVQKRTERDIWHSLHEFYLIEAPVMMSWKKLREMKNAWSGLAGLDVFQSESAPMKQQLSHQEIRARIWHFKLSQSIPAPSGYQWVAKKQIKQLAFPRMLRLYLDNHADLLK
ncbi:MAG TPA: A/G-specific adenine glycosylase, partial [Ferruginibacter sp.]|nr:A/G-specific adenine glycosylase [Ferruginibacter sp.]